MSRFPLYFYMLICLLPSSAGMLRAQEITMDHIRLTWDDFQGPRRMVSGHSAAHISYTMEYKMKSSAEKTVFEPRFYILREKSWVNRKTVGQLTPSAENELLTHEKGHLIIGALYFKELERSLGKLSYSKRIKHKARRSFNKVHRKMRRFNKRYDKKTSHGASKASQQQWNKKLLSELNNVYSLKEFKALHF